MSKLKKILAFFAAHKYVTTLVVFACLIGFLDTNSLYVRYKLYMEECDLQSQIDAYNEQFARDTKLYKELQSDPNAVVRVAREKYYMKKPNEDIYVFETPQTDEEAQ
jgi:cell division protein DivIC